MVYKDRFVAVVKCNGRVLREKDNIITLPFGSEYSLLLKNLESRKAIARVWIDGQDVIDGSLVLEPNSELELEGFLKGYEVGNKFKFIQKTEEIAEHRGDRIDDGVIRIEYRFEKKVEEEVVYRRTYRDVPPWRPWRNCPWCGCNPCCCPPYYYSFTSYDSKTDDSSVNYTLTNSDGETYSGTFASSVSVQAMNCSVSEGGSSSSRSTSQSTVLQENSKPSEDEGITVPGSRSGQVFHQGYHRELENNSHVITLKLRGVKSNMTPVKEPVTTKTKMNCPTCGTSSKSSADYCSKCGTALF